MREEYSDWLVAQGNALRDALNLAVSVRHPDDPAIRGVSHVMWTGTPTVSGADARNAVLYGKRAIDRSPCGTGTSARMAQLVARGRLAKGDHGLFGEVRDRVVRAIP